MENYREEELAALATRDTMIGVTQPNVATGGAVS